MDETEGFQCLGSSNWTICSPLSPFCSGNFQFVSPLYWGGQFLFPQRANSEKREKPNSRNEWDRGFECLGHSNWTICIPLSHFCSGNFQNFSLSYWEANSYYPRGLIVRKGSFANSRNGWDRGISVPGAFKLDHWHPSKPLLIWHFSKLFTFILGGQFLLPQRANSEKGEFCQFQKWMRQGIFSAWGLQTGPFEAL